MGEEDPALEAEPCPSQEKIRRSGIRCRRDLRRQWNLWDEGDEAARLAAQKAMVALLDRRRYLSNLVRDVTETLGA